ncbi:MAG: hypothetical protein ABSB22_04475 [Thermodesulfobacteriota bacterium]|jgi:hypothetical protein
MADEEIGKLVIRLSAEIGDLKKNFEEAKGQLKDLGSQAKESTESIKTGLGGIESGAKGIVGALSAIKASAIVYLGEQAIQAGQRVLSFAKSIAESAYQIERQSEILGISVTDYQKLNYAAKMSGVSSDSLSLALRTLARNMGEAQLGVGRAKPYFEALGISMADLKSKSPVDVLMLLADRFKNTEDGARKMEYASNLLATRYGDNLIPMMNKGSEGLKAFGDEAVRMGSVIGDVVVKKGSEAETTFNRLALQSNALKLSFGPLAVDIANLFEQIVSGIKKVKDGWDSLPAPLRGLLVPTPGGMKTFMGWWMGLGEKIGVVPPPPPTPTPPPPVAPPKKAALPPVVTEEEKARRAAVAMERLKIEEDAATAAETLAKEHNATLQTINEQQYKEGLSSEEDYLAEKHRLEEDSYRLDISLASKQASIMAKAYEEVVAKAPEKEKPKLKLQVDLEIQKAREKLLETTEKLRQIETKEGTEAYELAKGKILATEDARIKALEEEAKKEIELNNLRVQSGQMPAIEATMKNLDIQKTLNMQKINQLELEKALTSESAKKLEIDAKILVLLKDTEDEEIKKLKDAQELRDFKLAEAATTVSTLEAGINKQKELNALKVGLGMMRPEEATEFELDAQEKLNKASMEELKTKLQFVTTDAERLKITTDIANLELQLEDTEKRRLTLMESEAIKKMDVATLTTIGIQRAEISTQKELANQLENLLPNAVNVFTDSIKQSDGSFKNFFSNAEQGFLKLIQNILSTIAELEVLKALGYEKGGGGINWGSLLSSLFGGGEPGLNYNIQSPGIVGAGTPYQKGGTFIATKPTSIIAGEGGEPEIVSIVPISKMVSPSLFGPSGGISSLRPYQGFAGGGTIVVSAEGQGKAPQKIQLDLNVNANSNFFDIVAKARPTSEEIDLIVAAKYKAGGHLYKSIKER